MDLAGGSESLADLLGGQRGAFDASVPAVMFLVGWLVGHGSSWAAVGAAVGAGVLVAGWRFAHGHRPRAVVLGLLGVLVAAMVVLYTGRAVDFFLVQLVSNGVSGLLFLASVVVRWPLLGVMVGLALGQRTQWRRDPALLRAYGRGSVVWSGQYLLRLVAFLPLWLGGYVTALAAVRVALTWPLVAVTLAVSWWVIRRSLPPGHPGLRQPQVPDGRLSSAPAS